MTIENDEERNFYGQKTVSGTWSVRTLKRQYYSGLYERPALSRDKKDMMEMATKGAVPYRPADILKSPYVLEFPG